MSIEENLERIADALEKLTTFEFSKVGPIEHASCEENTAASGGEKVTRKKGASKKKAGAKKKAPVEEPDGPSREDVQGALVDFCKNGPGKAAAKEALEKFKAGSISTLDPKVYGAFIDRLAEVAEAYAA